MNKNLITSLLLVLGMQAFARSKVPEYKSWNSFRSAKGYSFKYPRCWRVGIDDPDENGPVEKARHLSVVEARSCKTPQLSVDTPNGIYFVGGGPRKTKAQALMEIRLREKFAPNDIASRRDLTFKRFHLGTNDAIAWVEVFPASHSIRWHTKVYCPDWWISVTGPEIDKPNIDSSLYAKFRKGDLAYPEPYKTIIDSIRCIPAK